jgi:lambda family phage portal protein
MKTLTTNTQEAKPRERKRIVRASFDSAVTNNNNSQHWKNADYLSADASISPSVLKILRSRSRYEYLNNSYCAGIVSSKAEAVIGTGPRLQLQTEDRGLNQAVEDIFMEWSQATNFARSLMTLAQAKIVDGEGLGIFKTLENTDLPISIFLQVLEADRIADNTMQALIDGNNTGIEFDKHGKPVQYRILKHHPGDVNAWNIRYDYDTIDAEHVIHWFKRMRPEQHRAVPEITPALPLFAQLRRYTLAVITAAETAADFAAVLYSEANAEEDGGTQSLEAMDVVELDRNLATVLPSGWKLGQIKAEQPTTAYGDFKRQILSEIARCLGVPYNIAAGDSSDYNYASGRLDHQTFFKKIRIEQFDLKRDVLDRAFAKIHAELQLDSEFRALRRYRILPHTWFFDGYEHVDPKKEADAQAIKLASRTTNLANEYARENKDWEVEIEQLYKERAFNRDMEKKYGLSLQETTGVSNDTESDEDEDDEGDGDE